MTKKTKAKKASRQITEKARKEKLEMDSDFCRMRTRYDPEAIRKEALATPIALAKRGALVTSKFATLFAKRESMMRADAEDGGLRYATAFKETLTSLGPLFVKLGQNLANRPDLVDEDLMEELTRLQDRVPPFPTEEAFAIMRDEGLEPDNAFSIITPEPVAAASNRPGVQGRLGEGRHGGCGKGAPPRDETSGGAGSLHSSRGGGAPV